MRVTTLLTKEGKTRYMLVDDNNEPVQPVLQYVKFKDNSGAARNTLRSICCGKAIQTPRLYECFDCGGKGLLHRHGFYLRYTITEEGSNEVLICRLKCRHCLHAFSVIPDFLIPYFQHTLSSIIHRLKRIIENKRTNGSRQLQAFHLKRFLKNINWIHSFFVEIGVIMGVQGEEKERAKKYLKMIQDFGESTFLRRSTGHYSTYFMAN